MSRNYLHFKVCFVPCALHSCLMQYMKAASEGLWGKNMNTHTRKQQLGEIPVYSNLSTPNTSSLSPSQTCTHARAAVCSGLCSLEFPRKGSPSATGTKSIYPSSNAACLNPRDAISDALLKQCIMSSSAHADMKCQWLMVSKGWCVHWKYQ